MRQYAHTRFFLALILTLAVWTLTCAPALAAVVHATYTFTDFTTRALSVKRVTVTPLASSADYAGAQLSNKPLIYSAPTYYTLTNGSITISNLVCGYAYKVAFSDGYSEPVITNYFGTNIATGTVVDANDYKTTYINFVNGSIIQVWYAYLSNTNSSGTSGALTNNDTRAVAFDTSLTIGAGSAANSIHPSAGLLTFSNSILANGSYIKGHSIIGTNFVGNGASLTNLHGSNSITAGTIDTNKMDATAYVAFKNDVTQAGLAAGSYSVAGSSVAGVVRSATNANYFNLSNFRLSLATNPIVPLIMDDDGEDIDGLIQHAVLLRLADLGEVDIKAITKCNTNEGSVGAVEVLNRFYGFPNIPVGVRRDGVAYNHTMSWETNITRLNTNLCSYFGNSNAPSSVALHRQILANSPANSQDFLVSGQSFDIYNLFNSPADSISSLTGAQLIFEKARDFYVEAGEYPTGSADHNFATAPTSAQVWEWIGTTNSANRVIYVDIDIGTGTATGGNYTNRRGYDPIYQACTNYIQAIGGSLPRPAWGSQGVLAAVRGTNQFFAGKRVFSFSAAGTNAIDGSGNNTFTTGAGNQFYLTSTLTTAEWNEYVNSLFDPMPMRTQTGVDVRRTGDTMSGTLAVNVDSTNAFSVGTNFIVDTTNGRLINGVARDAANNPIINARHEIVGSNATATVETEVLLQLSRSTGAGVSFAQGARFTVGRWKTPTSFSGDSVVYIEVKTDNSSLLGTGATWLKVLGLRSDGAMIGNGGGLTNLIANQSVYAAGTVYTFTASDALLDFGTTDPSITISVAGTYLISANAGLKFNAATYAAANTATVKLRRTNNTPADLSNGSRALTLPVLTTYTGGDVVTLPPIVYTAAAGDVISLFGILSAAPSVGSITAESAEIVIMRIQ